MSCIVYNNCSFRLPNLMSPWAVQAVDDAQNACFVRILMVQYAACMFMEYNTLWWPAGGPTRACSCLHNMYEM